MLMMSALLASSAAATAALIQPGGGKAGFIAEPGENGNQRKVGRIPGIGTRPLSKP